ncbi:MAG: DUF951 domain-containing protein [Candidatus Enteromonas sp.]|nr:DUF951 domain-containing protein [Candidatus Enteromonas sp.]
MVSGYSLYDEVEMKKPHPCSARNKRFQIIRLGADVKIVCLACGNVIMMDRDKFNSRIKKVIASHEGPIAPHP